MFSSFTKLSLMITAAAIVVLAEEIVESFICWELTRLNTFRAAVSITLVQCHKFYLSFKC